ncbi:hypothetical protein C4D60_Mb04t07610 [Musa balbisiana]|uniref:Uncharacterized protein n=1 Tax=Musa balbisiana TaxID=52838 RepID=A0A4S8KAF7_MUSBA|nr:hypothetical protein C4D60_Mb04t07610 [Musa balbisiana]
MLHFYCSMGLNHTGKVMLSLGSSKSLPVAVNLCLKIIFCFLQPGSKSLPVAVAQRTQIARLHSSSISLVNLELGC